MRKDFAQCLLQSLVRMILLLVLALLLAHFELPRVQ